MDGIIFIALIFWAFSALSKSAKKKKAAVPAQGPARPAPVAEPSQPLRPMDVDLPGQTTMPTHWGRYEAITDTLQNEDALMRKIYRDEPLRPLDQATLREAREKEQRQSKGEIPGLGLQFDANSLVKGVIYAEILTRPTDRRRR